MISQLLKLGVAFVILSFGSGIDPQSAILCVYIYIHYTRGYQADTVKSFFCKQTNSTLQNRNGRDCQNEDKMKNYPAS